MVADPCEAEAGNRCDPVLSERQHHESGQPRPGPARLREVVAERGLPVGARTDQRELRTPEPAGTQVVRDSVGTIALVRLRGHREPGIVAQDLDHPSRVTALEGIHESLDNRSLLR